MQTDPLPCSDWEGCSYAAKEFIVSGPSSSTTAKQFGEDSKDYYEIRSFILYNQI